MAGVICCFAVLVKFKAGYDDALDVVGVHFVGGLVGSLLIGFFADPEYFGGEFWRASSTAAACQLLGEQALANIVTIIWSGAVTAILLLALKATVGIRVTDEVEASGLDLAEHAETGYNYGESFMERL